MLSTPGKQLPQGQKRTNPGSSRALSKPIFETRSTKLPVRSHPEGRLPAVGYFFMLQPPRGLSGCSFYGPCGDAVSAALLGCVHEFIGVPDHLIEADGAIGKGGNPD